MISGPNAPECRPHRMRAVLDQAQSVAAGELEHGLELDGLAVARKAGGDPARVASPPRAMAA